MGRKGRITVLAVMLVAMAVGCMGCSAVLSSKADECYACQRPIHAHSKTVAFIEGHSRLFCCPACALSEHEQENRPVKVTQLTSFLTGVSLSPDSAFLVKGSDISMCATPPGITDADKRTADVHYDRCAPSLLAFAQQSEAADFAREHGGQVVAFKDAAAAFAK